MPLRGGKAPGGLIAQDVINFNGGAAAIIMEGASQVGGEIGKAGFLDQPVRRVLGREIEIAQNENGQALRIRLPGGGQHLTEAQHAGFLKFMVQMGVDDDQRLLRFIIPQPGGGEHPGAGALLFIAAAG